MRAAVSKVAIESQLASRFGEDVFKITDRGYTEVIPTGLSEVDALAGGLPRGCITEIHGAESSGRTSFMLSALAHATHHDETCALVDTSDVLDPHSAVNCGIDLERLLWVRCAGNLEYSFKAVDLLLQGGGFGLVVLDLADIQAKEVKRIISSWWYRFRRVVENTPTALAVIAQDSCARSCASLTLALSSKHSTWSAANEDHVIDIQPSSTILKRKQNYPSVPHANILRSNSITVERLKPMHIGTCKLQFTA